MLHMTLAGCVVVAAAAGCRSDRETPEGTPKPIEQPGAQQPMQERPVETQPGMQQQPAEQQPGQQQPAQQQPLVPEPQAGTDPDLGTFTMTAVEVDTKLASMCGLDGSQVYFKFDSTNLRPEAKDRLDKVVTCARDGAATGQQLRVVGHTDPIGKDEYNKKLGMNRAESVAKYLQDQGLAAVRVETASKGEMGAFANPFNWPLDRRVVIRIAK